MQVHKLAESAIQCKAQTVTLVPRGTFPASSLSCSPAWAAQWNAMFHVEHLEVSGRVTHPSPAHTQKYNCILLKINKLFRFTWMGGVAGGVLAPAGLGIFGRLGKIQPFYFQGFLGILGSCGSPARCIQTPGAFRRLLRLDSSPRPRQVACFPLPAVYRRAGPIRTGTFWRKFENNGSCGQHPTRLAWSAQESCLHFSGTL